MCESQYTLNHGCGIVIFKRASNICYFRNTHPLATVNMSGLDKVG